MNPSNKIERKLKINSTNDPSSIQAVTYNHQVGAQKNMEMGHHLIPIPTSATTFTADVSGSAVALPSKGITLAIYNNSSTAYAVTLGDSAVTTLAIGVTNAAGSVGIPCTPNNWTYIATFDKTHVISNSSNLKVMIVADSTVINSQ
jgi:hypothetical protein